MKWLLIAISILFSLCICEGADYTNPVIVPDSPDPGVLNHEGTWYAVTTSGDAADIFPIHTSKDLVHWKHEGHVFPSDSKTKPSWAVSNFWAPELHLIHSNGKINVYFAAQDSTGRLCVGVASADHPLGPYKAKDTPLARNASMGYIDPTYFEREDGVSYLYWKTDGNAVNQPTDIMVQRLESDGLSLDASFTPRLLLTNNLSWEANCIEGPWVFAHHNFHYIFYSGNMYNSIGPNGTCLYAVGVAKSSAGPLGPYTKHPFPILRSIYTRTPSDKFTGPGHCSVVKFNATTDYMVYHAWSLDQIGGGYPRHMLTDVISWSDGWPKVYDGHPSDSPQPIP